MLRGSGCRYLRCRFCDYHLDSSRNEEENYKINKEALSKVNGIYHSLEVINSGSFLELDEKTMEEIRRVCKEKQISQLRFEVHWMYHKHVQKWKDYFKKQGITLKIKWVWRHLMIRSEEKSLTKEWKALCRKRSQEWQMKSVWLFGISGQTAESMQKDIETGLKYFERICINIMVENTTPIRPDQEVIRLLWNRFIRNIKKTKGWIFCFKIQILESEEKKRRKKKMNEILLVLSLLVIYGSVLLVYRLFGKSGLYCFTAIATITANIEVLILVDAFGMEQTLGNILFASTFLVTDIISEVDGKKAAQKAVNIGIFTSLFFIVVSKSWLLYRPSASDWAQPAIKEIFSNTPRLMIVSVLVYAICQRFDVWAYHKWWAITKKHFNGDSRKALWLRNNGSTLISQLLNTLLYTFGAFWGMYQFPTLVSIALASYVIFIITSIADTPFVYLARKMHEKGSIPEDSSKDFIK